MATQKFPYVTLDVFTSTRYSGNPLAAVFLPEPDPLTPEQRQTIAREFNFVETIFFHAQTPTELYVGSRRISIHTTEREIPFAGHPTIGAASWTLIHSPNSKETSVSTDKPPIHTLVTKAGPMPITLSPSLGPTHVSASIPHNVHIHSTRLPLSTLLSIHPTLRPSFPSTQPPPTFPIVSPVYGMTMTLIPLPSLSALASATVAGPTLTVSTNSTLDDGVLDPDWSYPDAQVPFYFYVRDVADEATGKNVIRTRMMVRDIEDPATGSAACALSAYLALTEHEEVMKSEREFRVVQGVEMGRRSDIGVKVALKEIENGLGIERV